MDDAPCIACSQLIGGDSAIEPHAHLQRLNFRKTDRGRAADDLVAFFRCNVCGTLLVRNQESLEARWDWI